MSQQTLTPQTTEQALELKLASIALPQNSAKAYAAKDAYQAGWQAAALVAAARPDTHPADRRPVISPNRLTELLKSLPKTANGWLSNATYDLTDTTRTYARRGYTAHVEYVLKTQWLKFLAENPDQATPEMLRKRKKVTYDRYAFGSAFTHDTQGLKFLPRTEDGNHWMYSELGYNIPRD